MATAGLFSMLGGGDEAAMQRQLDEQRAQAFAQQTQEQRLAGMGYKAGAGLGQGIAGAFGVDVTDPTIRQAAELRRMAADYDVSSPEGLMQMAQALRATNPQMAVQLAEKAQSMMQSMSVTSKNMKERAAADPFQKLLEAGKYTPASVSKYEKTGDKADLELVEKVETKGEFERMLSSLGLSPDEEKKIKQQWVTAKLNPDPSGLKGLNAQLASLQVQQKELDLAQKKDKAEAEKVTAIEKLSNAEAGLDTALGTAEKALKLAPGSFTGAAGQAVTSSIPWTDAKALKNLVSSLNSEKVIQTLEQMKAQSRTGATGFGSVSEKELQLMLDKIRALDPSDKMFKENLETVMQGWNKVKQQTKQSRLKLQGKENEANLEAMIDATITHNRSKGNMTRAQAINLLKSSGKIPSNY